MSVLVGRLCVDNLVFDAGRLVLVYLLWMAVCVCVG